MSIRIISLILTLPLPPSFSCSLVDDMIERHLSLSLSVYPSRAATPLSPSVLCHAGLLPIFFVCVTSDDKFKIQQQH